MFANMPPDDVDAAAPVRGVELSRAEAAEPATEAEADVEAAAAAEAVAAEAAVEPEEEVEVRRLAMAAAMSKSWWEWVIVSGEAKVSASVAYSVE